MLQRQSQNVSFAAATHAAARAAANGKNRSNSYSTVNRDLIPIISYSSYTIDLLDCLDEENTR